MVALLAEGVDRNHNSPGRMCVNQVALLAEGVDRNKDCEGELLQDENVALLAEGVDRNQKPKLSPWMQARSPSSRRAWIEMLPLPAG